MTSETRIMTLPKERRIGLDAGGTNLTAVDGLTGEITTLDEEFSSMDEVLDHLLARFPGTTHVYIGGAGVVNADGTIKFTNRKSWPAFDSHRYAAWCCVTIGLGNDMEPKLAGLADAKVTVVRPGTVKAGDPTVVVTVSTGDGNAALVNGTVARSEGGHTTWQPMTELEDAILRCLRRSENRKLFSVEDILGGRHMQHLYMALWEVSKQRPTREFDATVQRYIDAKKDIGPLITAGALHGDAFCEQFMEVYGHILGQWLRNLAVIYVSTGGIYLTGGVMTPEVTRYLFQKGALLEAFFGNPAHDELLWDMPIFRVDDPLLGAKGALALARQM